MVDHVHLAETGGGRGEGGGSTERAEGARLERRQTERPQTCLRLETDRPIDSASSQEILVIAGDPWFPQGVRQICWPKGESSSTLSCCG